MAKSRSSSSCVNATEKSTGVLSVRGADRGQGGGIRGRRRLKGLQGRDLRPGRRGGPVIGDADVGRVVTGVHGAWGRASGRAGLAATVAPVLTGVLCPPAPPVATASTSDEHQARSRPPQRRRVCSSRSASDRRPDARRPVDQQAAAADHQGRGQADQDPGPAASLSAGIGGMAADPPDDGADDQPRPGPR